MRSTAILMADAYPASHFVGFDPHRPSIEAATEAAAQAGVADRCRFEVAYADGYPGDGSDLVACFDSLHDMGDPIGAAAHVRRSLRPDGTWLVVEPFARDRLEDDLDPVGRIFYSVSTTVCTPNARSQGPGPALGAQAGERRLRDVFTAAGFRHVRRAGETPFNLVLEVRP